MISTAYVIPATSLSAELSAHLRVRERFYAKRNEPQPATFIFCDQKSGGEIPTSIGDVKLVYSVGTWFEKLASVHKDPPDAEYIVFATQDDLTCFSQSDVTDMKQRGAKVSTGKFLLCRPVSNRGFRIYTGWTHLREYMGTSNTTERFLSFIGEGPHTLWACYEKHYFLSLSRMVADLVSILEPQEWNLIEDCINLANLLQDDSYASDSVCLRFMDGPYGSKINFTPSWVALDAVRAQGRLLNAVSAIKEHLIRVSGSSTFHALSERDLSLCLGLHTEGYKRARGRKWREWIDVEYRPFDSPGAGVCASGDKENPYLSIYIWAGGARLHERFPTVSWLNDPQLKEFVHEIPLELWDYHAKR